MAKRRKLKIHRLLILIFIVAILISLIVYAASQLFKLFRDDDLGMVCAYDPLEPTVLDIEVMAEHYLLFNYATDTDYLALDPDAMIYPASLTKLMTLDTVINAGIDLNATVIIDEDDHALAYSRNASIAGLEIGEEYSLNDILHAMILPSGADACSALENYFASRGLDLVSMMNERALNLGMNDSHFANTTGLYEDDNYTTLHDLKLLLRDIYQNKDALNVVNCLTYTATNGQGFTSTIYDLGLADLNMVKVLGGKTGYTGESKLNIVVNFNNGKDDYALILAEVDDSVSYNHALDVEDILTYLYPDLVE